MPSVLGEQMPQAGPCQTCSGTTDDSQLPSGHPAPGRGILLDGHSPIPLTQGRPPRCVPVTIWPSLGWEHLWVCLTHL